MKKNVITTLKEFLLEGIAYNKNENTFIFDFKKDNEEDIIKLVKMDLEPIDIYDNTYYYGFEFEPDIDSNVRTKFIKSIKFDTEFEKSRDFNLLVYNSVLNLNRTIDLPDFNTIIFPQTQSNLNRKIISEIGKLTFIDNYTTFELIKNIPKNISFNFNKFNNDELNKLNDNGNPVYPEHTKRVIIENIENMLKNIKNSDYFSIARSVKKDKYRKYFENFLTFTNDEEKQRYLEISKTNKDILIIDDVSTTGSTLYEMLRVLRSINNKNKIVIFTLLGKKFNI